MAKLTQRQCATLSPGKYNDGGGLWLHVKASGARKWFVRIVIDGKRRELGGGGYPATTLAQAREKATEMQRLAKQGIDPTQAQATDQAAQEVPTFTSAAARFILAHRRGWSNPKHARQWVSTLKRYARPVIGSVPVDRITTEQALAIVSPIWTTKTETAKRVQARIEAVLDYASAMRWRDQTNPARWRGHLQRLLPAPAKVKRMANDGEVRHQPAMPYVEVPAFMRELEALDSISAKALLFLILTATRTSEVLEAQWHEVDREAATWTVPATRMKARRLHRVPLSDQALAILDSVPSVHGSEYVFPGARTGKPLSNMALLQVMRGLGHGVGGKRSDAVPHGFRSSFRDWSSERTGAPHAVIEAALAHVAGDATVRAYARSDLFDRRRELMQAWSNYLDQMPAQNVVPITRSKVA